MVKNIRGIFPYCMRRQVFMVLVDTDRINGIMTKDPYKFRHIRVAKVVLRQNGRPVMINSITTSFDPNDLDAIMAYNLFCQGLDVGMNGQDVNVTYAQFVNGFTVWVWTISPDMDANNGIGLPQKPGNFDADIYVEAGHTTNTGLTALFLGKTRKAVQIGQNNYTTVV